MTPDERREFMSPILMASLRANPTSIEVAVRIVLVALGVEFIEQYPLGRYVVDFFVESRMLVIECDGSYWHAKPGCAEKDAARDAWMGERGFKVIRIPEETIRGGGHEAILKSVV